MSLTPACLLLRLQLLAEAESRDQGKTLAQARHLEIPRCATNLRFYASLLLNHREICSQTEAPAVHSTSQTVHEPIGVVGVISPWNLPLYLLTWKVAPALAMGNCVIAKPSELTSLTAFMLTSMATEAGFPPGVFNVIFGTGDSAGRSLVEHPQVQAVSFTGGTVTGRKIAAMAAPLGKKCSLELGGKNAAVVFADCDLDEAVQTSVRAAFSNQGEICLCCSRVYVHEAIYAEFARRFVQESSKLVVGDPLDPQTSLGSVISQAHLEKILSYLELARSEGAQILLGGERRVVKDHEGGYFVAPTIIAGAAQSSRLMQEEIFGPVVCLSSFSTEEQAISLANDVQYGLATSIWTLNGGVANRVARQVKSGVVWINCWMVRDLATPFGGMKASGIGREGGTYSLEFFSDIKTITTAL